jgi:hypothetical protein
LGTPIILLKLSTTTGLFYDISPGTSRFSNGAAAPPSAGLGTPLKPLKLSTTTGLFYDISSGTSRFSNGTKGVYAPLKVIFTASFEPINPPVIISNFQKQDFPFNIPACPSRYPFKKSVLFSRNFYYMKINS